MLQVQIAQQQETRDVTQTDMKDQESGAGEVEVGVLIAESAPYLSDKKSLDTSQPTSPKRPEKLKVKRRGSQTRHRSRSRVKAILKPV
jgi:hypothetical protein